VPFYLSLWRLLAQCSLPSERLGTSPTAYAPRAMTCAVHKKCQKRPTMGGGKTYCVRTFESDKRLTSFSSTNYYTNVKRDILCADFWENLASILTSFSSTNYYTSVKKDLLCADFWERWRRALYPRVSRTFGPWFCRGVGTNE
jgi:hypothetical protein